jgi:hypothetical protein
MTKLRDAAASGFDLFDIWLFEDLTIEREINITEHQSPLLSLGRETGGVIFILFFQIGEIGFAGMFLFDCEETEM